MARGDVLKSGYSSSSYSRSPNLLDKPVIQYLIIFSIIATLVISIFSLINTYQLKKVLIVKTINVNDLLKKLTANSEMKGYVGTAPLNIIQINSNNLGNLQSQMSGLDISYISNFIIQYSDRVVVYDYDNDKIKGTFNLQQQAQLPNDLLTKLYKHAELKGLENQKPVVGQLDAASLNTLKQQFPDVYKDSKAGDFLLRYQTKLIIYDYNTDKIVNSVNLG